MLVEFVKNFKKACDENYIDIVGEYWDTREDRNTDSLSIEVMFTGITFSFEIYIWDNEVRAVGGAVCLMLKGVEYYSEHFSMIESYGIDDDVANIEEIIDSIISCDLKKRMVKLVHAVDEFFESYDDDFDQEFIMEYIKMHYDNY